MTPFIISVTLMLTSVNMSKTKAKQTEPKQPEYVDELLLNGQATVTAKSREELAEMVDAIPADCSYAVGAVGYNSESGMYCLCIHLTNNYKP